ncbi:hypothetical protein D3C73_1196520 [compost metagenome]
MHPVVDAGEAVDGGELEQFFLKQRPLRDIDQHDHPPHLIPAILLHWRGSNLIIPGLAVHIPAQLAFFADQRIGIHHVIDRILACRKKELGQRLADSRGIQILQHVRSGPVVINQRIGEVRNQHAVAHALEEILPGDWSGGKHASGQDSPYIEGRSYTHNHRNGVHPIGSYIH